MKSDATLRVLRGVLQEKICCRAKTILVRDGYYSIVSVLDSSIGRRLVTQIGRDLMNLAVLTDQLGRYIKKYEQKEITFGL